MALPQLIDHLPADLRIVVADVGSVGGLSKRWTQVAPIVWPLLFDPREDGEVRQEGRARIFPVALGQAPGVAQLNLTALGNMSSMLVPNAGLLSRFRKKPADTQLVGTIGMPVDSLDNVTRSAGVAVDVLKIDTQGSELDVLRGAEVNLASSVFFAEIEVSFLERYRGQVLFDEIAAHMRDRHFELIDVYRLKRYRHASRAGIGNVSLGQGQRAGRLAYGDAWFMLSDSALSTRLTALPAADAALLLQKAMIVQLVYGKADMAAWLFDIAEDRLDPGVRNAWAALFRRLSRRRYGFQNIHHVLDYLARRA